jgi:hypothetical protein
MPSLRLLRSSQTSFLIAVIVAAFHLGPVCTALANNYSDLAAQGYRWAIVDGPYVCTSEQDVQRIVGHHTDETELHMVESIRCYYLIPGTIVQVIREDPANGMSEIRLGSITRSLWTYSRFLSKHPVHDTYGDIETPENSGLVRTAEIILPVLLDSPTPQSRQHENP